MNTVIDFKSIEQISIHDKECIKLNFGSVLNQKDAIRVCNEWKAVSQVDKTKKYVIIFNAKDMIDYEPMTRTSFQNTMKELKDQIDQIWVISESKLIRGGAAIMGMLTSFSIKAVNSEEQIIF
jgi:hypothetical protein